MSISHEQTFEYESTPLRVVFSSTPFIPEKVYGPPEDCYPAEGGEVEIEEIFIGDHEVSLVLRDEVLAYLQERCETYVSELEEDFNEPEEY